MNLYRKKPVVVEAEQFFPDKTPWPTGVVNRLRRETPLYSLGDPDDWVAVIKTLEGWRIVSPGDWIIKEVTGEIYPCKPDVFEARYESVTAEEG